MESIGSSQMARLIREGFQGEIRFEGRVFGRLTDRKDFYRAEGGFTLLSVKNDYLLQQTAVNMSSTLIFTPVREKVTHSHQVGYEPSIGVPIVLPKDTRAFLQIDPRKIIF